MKVLSFPNNRVVFSSIPLHMEVSVIACLEKIRKKNFFHWGEVHDLHYSSVAYLNLMSYIGIGI